MPGVVQAAIDRLRNAPSQSKKLRRADFDLSNGTGGQESQVATYQAKVPLRIKEGAAARILFTTVEEFTTDGSADNTETFNLAHDLVESPNGTPFVLYEGGNRVAADSVDYSADSFDYTDDGTNNTLTVVYVARDPGVVTIERRAPKNKGNLTDDLYEDVTAAIAETDQNKDPIEFDFTHPLDGVIPKNWRIVVTVDAPAPVEWDDSAENNPQGVTASAASLSFPVEQYQRGVPVAKGVKAAILGLEA